MVTAGIAAAMHSKKSVSGTCIPDASYCNVDRRLAGQFHGGSPIMETIGLLANYDLEAEKDITKYLAGINKESDHSKSLKEELRADEKQR